MRQSVGVAVCVAYSVGLLVTGLGGQFAVGAVTVSGPALLLGGITLGFAAIAPRRWQLGLQARHWALLAGVGLLASGYLALRSPVPGPQDISHYVERVQAIAPTQILSGQVLDEPSLNRDLKGRFPLAVKRLQVADANGQITFQIPVRGKLYVTAPLLQVTGLHTGQWLTATGRLYRPQPALNPHGFDFQETMEQRGIFAGLVAESLQFPETPAWGLWRVRQRLVRTQVRALGSPLGQLVSAMALGRRAVDLPFDIQDVFARVGLAHTIAASGFHVSLLLGTVLALLRSRAVAVRVTAGLLVLGGYILLTGLQPSVLRAALMGVAALIGLATERKVKPVGALLIAVTLMLLVNPLWIWNIGFQLSVVATFGLIVTVPGLTRRLDWLPVTVTALLAVPLAATLWTLPLMLYHFNVISGLSILLNVIATPLVTVISLGGMVSSALALLSPAIGGPVAHLLYLPALGLLSLAQWASQLPGSAIAIGQIHLWQLIGLYAILFASLLPPPAGQSTQASHPLTIPSTPHPTTAAPRDKRLLPLAFLALILLPLAWQGLTQYQIAVLAAGDDLIWVMQDHGQTTLVNSGAEKTAFYTVAPYLRQAGVNRIDRAIALSSQDDWIGWKTLLQQIPSRTLYGPTEASPLKDLYQTYHPLPVGQSQALPHLTVQPLGTENPILRLTTPEQSWLLLPDLPLPLQDHLAGAGAGLQSQVLVWNGAALSAKLLAVVQPQVAIAYGRTLPESVERQLQQAHIRVFWTAREGAVTWRDRGGFRGYRETRPRNPVPWG